MNGNDNEWAIGFHGSTKKGTQAIAESRIFKAGTRQAYSRDIDTNKLSDNSGKPCGDGVYFAADIEIAQGYSRFSPEDSPCVLQVSQACWFFYRLVTDLNVPGRGVNARKRKFM